MRASTPPLKSATQSWLRWCCETVKVNQADWDRWRRITCSCEDLDCVEGKGLLKGTISVVDCLTMISEETAKEDGRKTRKEEHNALEEKVHEEETDHMNKRKVEMYSGTSKSGGTELKNKKKQKNMIADLRAPDQKEDVMNDEYTHSDSSTKKDEDIGFKDHHFHGEIKETVDKQEGENKKKKKKKQTKTDSREEELVPDVFHEQHATVDYARKLELEKERCKRKQEWHETGANEDEGKETHDGVHSASHAEGISADVGKVVEKGEGEKESKKNKKQKKSQTSASLVNEGLLNDDEKRSDGVQRKEEGNGKKWKKAKSQKDARTNHVDDNKTTIKTGVEDCEPSGNSHPGRSAKKVKFSDHVEVFPSGASGDSVDNGLVQGKRFSPEEDELVKEAVFNYIDRHCLGEESLQMLMNSGRHPELRRCWAEIGEALPWRPVSSVYYQAHILFERGEKRKWTQEELDLVKNYHDQKGARWKTLATELGKHRFHVKDAWRRINVTNKKKGPWSLEEIEKLYELVNMDLRMKGFADRKVKHGMLRDNISWEAISEKLSTRSNAIC
ncbi:RNA polymerase I termination factor-like protein [Drosera capensis]